MIGISNKSSKDVIAKSKELIAFCLKNSTHFVLAKRHEGSVPKDILQGMQEEKVRAITERSRRQREYAKIVSGKELRQVCL